MTSTRKTAFVSVFSRAALGHQHHRAGTFLRNASGCNVSLPSSKASSFLPPSQFHQRHRGPSVKRLPLPLPLPSPSPLVTAQPAKQKYRHLQPLPVYASIAPQQETDWNEVSVLSVSPACEDHTLLTVNVGTTYALGSLTDAYRVPGMYVKLLSSYASENEKPLFLAVSSPPTVSGVFEFLIKDADSNRWVRDLKAGDAVFSSPVQGPGFRLAQVDPTPKHILLFATGSGIAPIRAAIESPLNGVFPRKRDSVTLLYGAQTPQRMAYTERFDEWRDNGVNVVPVISRPDDSWTGRTGYIQNVMDDYMTEDVKNTACLLCGLRGMTEEVKQKLIGANMEESKILFNF